MDKGLQNPLEIVSRGNEMLRQELINLDEMTYSAAVNTRDFSEEFRRIVELWDRHASTEERILDLLKKEGYKPNVENLNFYNGSLRELERRVSEALKLGDEDLIRSIIKNELCLTVDLLRAHMLAIDDFIASIDWQKLDEDVLNKIRLLQIIPSEKIIDL